MVLLANDSCYCWCLMLSYGQVQLIIACKPFFFLIMIESLIITCLESLLKLTVIYLIIMLASIHLQKNERFSSLANGIWLVCRICPLSRKVEISLVMFIDVLGSFSSDLSVKAPKHVKAAASRKHLVVLFTLFIQFLIFLLKGASLVWSKISVLSLDHSLLIVVQPSFAWNAS